MPFLNFFTKTKQKPRGLSMEMFIFAGRLEKFFLAKTLHNNSNTQYTYGTDYRKALCDWP